MVKNNIRLSFALPSKLQERMKKRMFDENYNQKQKSLWITEAINSLLNAPNAIKLVNYTGDSTGMDKHESIYISDELKRKLFDFQINVKREHIEMNSIQSRIIRASITQRLLRKPRSVTDHNLTY